jgi:hypothetical protein
MVKLTDHDSLSRETVRRRLAENHLKPWQKDMWCIPQLIGEARRPIPVAPGRLERFDYEYRRNGAVNLFVFVDADRSWRRVSFEVHPAVP